MPNSRFKELILVFRCENVLLKTSVLIRQALRSALPCAFVALGSVAFQSASAGTDDTNEHGITGGGTRGITGGGTRGITGGGTRGITGGGTRGITGGGTRGLALGAAAGTSVGSAAMGPVEGIALAGEIATVTVLGQEFQTDAAMVGSVVPGDYVVIASDLTGHVTVLDSLGVPYVPGASPVGVLGQVRSVDPSVATMAVGGLTVNYTAHLASDSTYVPQAGDVVEAHGVQPLHLGDVLIGLGDPSESVELGGQ